MPETPAHFHWTTGEDHLGSRTRQAVLCNVGGLGGSHEYLLARFESDRHAEDREQETLQLSIEQVLNEALAEVRKLLETSAVQQKQ